MKYIQETVVGQNGKNICPGAVSLLCHWSVRLMKLFFEKWLLTHVFGMQKKIAVLNDLSGYGRCSLTAAMPVISALKVQCCPVVTAVLSNHAGYPECYMDDYTDRMEAYLEPWRKMGFEMDGIMTGFLGSARQASIVADFIRDFKRENTQVLVDPTMGDHGHLYSVCDEDLIEAMRELMQYADVVTPNLTEACALTDTLYQEILNVIHERGKEPVFHATKFVAGNYHGTGDVFAAVIGASMVRGVPMEEAVRRAAAFTKKCVEKTEELGAPEQDGLCLEECLSYLTKLS